jgi:hypothetical protein
MLKNSQNASGQKLGFFLWKILAEAFSGGLSPLPKSRAKPRDLELGNWQASFQRIANISGCFKSGSCDFLKT